MRPTSKGTPLGKAVEAIIVAVTRKIGSHALPADEITKIIEDYFDEQRERIARKVKEQFVKHAKAGTDPVHDVVVAVRGFDGPARMHRAGVKHGQ